MRLPVALRALPVAAALLAALLSPGLSAADEAATARLVVDLDPRDEVRFVGRCVRTACSSEYAAGSLPDELFPHDGRLFFAATNPEHGRELWVSDGTAEGTRLVADLTPGPADSPIWTIASLGDRLLFAFRHFEGLTGSTFLELFSTDGTPEGTAKLSGPIPDAISVGPDRLYFFSPSPNDGLVDLRSTDGTAAGTRTEARLCAAACGSPTFAPSGPFVAGENPAGVRGVYYFDAQGRLWWRPGTAGSAAIRLAEPAGGWGNAIETLVAFGGGVAIRLRAADDEWELWLARPGGEAALLRDGDRVVEPTAVGGRLFFLATSSTDPPLGRDVWVSDGTPVGTHRIAHVDENVPELVPFRGQLFVVAGACDGGTRVLTLDPPTEKVFSSCWPGPPPSDAGRPDGDLLTYLTRRQDGVEGGHVAEIWASDGTAAGTRRVIALETPAESDSSDVPPIWDFAALGGRLFLSAETDARGFELHEVTGRPLADPSLHVQQGRYRVRVRWQDHHGSGDEGEGYAVPVTGASGFFWFFRRENLELVAKILDGSPVNGHDWVFYGGITDLEYWLDVTDLEDDVTRSYHHPPGDLCGGADTLAFLHDSAASTAPASWAAGGLSAPPAASAHATSGPAIQAAIREASSAPYGACPEGALCLGVDGRFAARVRFRNQYAGGVEGTGHPVPATDRSGWFWFFRPHNLEVMVKVLDGTPVNGHHWVLTGGVTTVEHWLEVTDRAAGATRTYHHPAESTCGRADTAAF